MKIFPANAKFCFPWRPYQAQVLEELEVNLDDNHLNIVAAPGSGKTILGLEVMLRINKPTLVLSPSIAIRNQWVSRFTENFLQLDDVPDWISRDIRTPKFLTVSTYQGLHAAFTDKEELDDSSLDLDEENEGEDEILAAEKILQELRKQKIQTIVIDEAHHLRNAWWKSLNHLKDNIKKPYIVALTATPPYDVSPQEWKNYQNLCGPIDAEITVPELIQEQNLCPHQDYVFLNSLSREENAQVKVFRQNVKSFLNEIQQDQIFIDILKKHPCLQDPHQNIEIILKNPEYFSSVAIFLKSTGVKVPRSFFKIIGGSTWKIPKFEEEWGEILFKNFLYEDTFIAENHKDFALTLKRKLKEAGAIEKRTVFLRNNNAIKRLLKESVNKLNSILEIVELEQSVLGTDLRMVILTDFIREEAFPNKGETFETPSRIGVVPIFESIRHKFPKKLKLGILSGSIVVIPTSSKAALKTTAQSLDIPVSLLKLKTLPHDENFVEVSIKGVNNQKIVHLITELFTQGEIQVIVGTKSLLGEGWDAPSINTLVLASFVGSFMLSNQMRGRAIRINKDEPNKVSNIWHLASVEKNSLYAGHDFEMLKRRFKAFVGIDIQGNTIENGFERMRFGSPPFDEGYLDNRNTETKELAVDRQNTADKWAEILSNGEIKKIIPEIKTDKESLPRNFVFYNTIFALFWRSLMVGAFVFLQYINKFAESLRYRSQDLESIAWNIGIGILIALAFSIPGLIKALWLFLRNGPVAGNMKQIGNALLKTLCKIEAIKTDVNKLRVISERDKYGMVFCNLEGGTSYEKSLFLDCLEEIVSPIDNPRYILTRKSRLNFWLRKDFHTVPQVIGTNKKSATFFSLMWNKYVGANKLIYTRSIEGRSLLLRARQKAMSTSFQKRSEKVETWK